MKTIKLSKTQILQVILLILTLVIIFGHSAMPPKVSSSESSFVAKLLEPILVKLFPEGADLEHFVRKAAHFTEFFLLGLQLFLLIKSLLRTSSGLKPSGTSPEKVLSKAPVHRAFLLSPAISWCLAFFDETIQIFSGRGPAIQDVWLDTFGAVTACLILWLLHLIKRK